jgi:hypothetical protein
MLSDVRWPLRYVLLAGLALLAILPIAFYAYAGMYGFNAVLRRGGTVWVPVKPDDQKLSASMRLALQNPAPKARAGAFGWREVLPGFEVSSSRRLLQEQRSIGCSWRGSIPRSSGSKFAAGRQAIGRC